MNASTMNTRAEYAVTPLLGKRGAVGELGKHSTRAAALAQSLLTEYTDFGYVEVLIHPDNVNKSYKRDRKKDRGIMEHHESEIFPNPANDYLIYQSNNLAEVSYISILDTQGRSMPIDYSGQQTLIINVASFSNGKYTLKLFDTNGIVLNSLGFVIQR